MTDVRVDEGLREGRDEPPRRLGIAALAQDTAVYGGTRVLLKSLAFLLVPLFAHFLTPAEFGVLELILATVALVDVFINLPGALARFYFDDDEPAWRRQVISLYFAIETSYPALLIGALIALSGQISDRVVGTETYAGLFVIAFVDLYLTNIVDLPMNLCRLRRKPFTFAAYSLTRGLTQVVFSILLVAVWHLGVKGILVASLVSVCLAFVITLREYIRDLTTRVSWRVGIHMLSFAWPTVVGGLAFYVLNLLDRFFVRKYHGLDDAGLYGTAFRYSQVVVIGVFAFRMGWPQWHYSWLHTGRHPDMVARGARYFFFAISLLAVVLSAWILPLFQLILPEPYWNAARAVPPLSLAAAATGAFTVFAVGFNVTKRMRLLPPLVVVAAAAAVGLYFLLIPPYSFVGAAWATVASLWGLALLVVVVSNRIYAVPWPWPRLALVIGAAFGFCLAALAIDAWLPLAPSIPARLGLTVGFPALLVACRYFPARDLAVMRARVLSLYRRATGS